MQLDEHRESGGGVSWVEYHMWFAYTARTSAIWHWQWMKSRRRQRIQTKHLRRATLRLKLRLNLCQVRQEKANRDKRQQHTVCILERERERDTSIQGTRNSEKQNERNEREGSVCCWRGVGAFVNA